jgi:hypothetical protein
MALQMVTVLAHPTVKQTGSEWANHLEHPTVKQMESALVNQ